MNRKITLIAYFFVLTCHLQAQVDVLTQRNDNMRTGWNSQETKLDTSNVNTGSFGKLATYVVDGQIYAQPLVVNNVNIPVAGVKNIVYVATVNNSIYAFDATDATNTSPYWTVNLTPSGSRPPTASDIVGSPCIGYKNITGKFGIIGTPVIDKNSQTMYLVTRSVNTSGPKVFQQFLHALDITTGLEKSNSPVLITATMSGTGDASVGGVLSFDAWKENQRSALLLLNGTVYIAYSSHCDQDPYHGWFLGYDATTLAQTIVYNTTPDGGEGAIWMSGAGPAADASGNIYVSVANGTVGDGTDPTAGRNRGESLLKLTPSGNTLSISSYFTPNTYDFLNSRDLDMGVIQVLLIPNTTFAITGSKDGHLYVTNRDNMGGYATPNDNIVQTVILNPSANIHASFGYYKGTANEFVYLWSENIELDAFPFNHTTGQMDNAGKTTNTSTGPTGQTGAFLSVSSNGADDASAILWASHPLNPCNAEDNTCPGILRAFKASNVSQEIWNSNMIPADNIGNFAKFVPPTIANGKVFMATFSNQLVVFGLTSNPLPIKLLSFTGQDMNDQYISLRWSVASQINNKYFEVERSNNGSDFHRIDSVSGAGNTNVTQQYSANDMNPESGVNFYRLKQVDIDGNSSYSGIVIVRFGKQAAPLLYPNPANNDFTVIAGQLPIEEVVVFDMLGKTIAKTINAERSPTLKLSAAYLMPGTYIVQVRTSSQVFTLKLNKQ